MNANYFILKYNSTFDLLWTKEVGVASEITSSKAIYTDSGGNIYITGTTNNGTSGQPLQGAQDYFVDKYNTAGNLL